MSWGMRKDLGAYIKPVYAGAEVDGTAASTGDNTEVNGAWIDRQGFESMDFLLAYTATLQQSQTLAVIANVQDADNINGGGAADVAVTKLTALSSVTLATGDSGGAIKKGCYQIGIDLTMCKRYVRVQWTPNLSASGTDTFKIQQAYLLTGSKYAPATTARSNIRAIATT